MNHLPYWLVAIWFGGAFLLVIRKLNYIRLILNNLAPGVNYWDAAGYSDSGILYARFRIDGISIKPALLNEIGRQQQKKAIRNERILYVWGAGGFLLIIAAFSYFGNS